MNENTNGTLSQSAEVPECFGDPGRVCPSDEEGIMQPQSECLGCSSLRLCLQAALRRKGVLAASVLDSPAATRVKGFFKRWSERKLAHSASKTNDSSED